MRHSALFVLFVAATTSADWPSSRVTDVSPQRFCDETEHCLSFFTPGSTKTFEVADHYPECQTFEKDDLGSDACAKVSCEEVARVPRIKTLTYTDRELRIEWQAPAYLSAFPALHEISVYDAENPLSVSSQNISDGTCATMHAPKRTSDRYEVKMRSVTIGVNYSPHRSEYVVQNLACLLPPEPASVMVVDRRADRIRFEIKPSYPARSVIEIKSRANLRKSGSGLLAEAINLRAYETITVSLRTCFVDGGTEVSFCGNFAHFRMKSNVASPSAVRNLRVLSAGFKRDEIRFRPPEFSHGPIDEYRISYQSLDGGFKREEVTRGLGISVSGLHTLRSYNISVVACNLDLQNRSIRHEGEIEYIILPARPQLFWYNVFKYAVRFMLFFISIFTLNDLRINMFLDVGLIVEQLNLDHEEYLQMTRILMFVELRSYSF